MAEAEIYERTIERLCGEVDALRSLLLAVAQELPERATYHVSDHARWMRERADEEARIMPNTRRRDYSAGVWDTATEVEQVLEMRRGELEEGARTRTIQPTPIPKDEQIFPEKGW